MRTGVDLQLEVDLLPPSRPQVRPPVTMARLCSVVLVTHGVMMAAALVAPTVQRRMVGQRHQTRRMMVSEEEEVVKYEYSGDDEKKMRVAIAGGGVGGLTTALALLKKGCDVTVFERTSKFARFGGPIQLASNALSTLKAIDERLFARVMANFTFTGTRRTGIKDGIRSDGNFRMTPVLDPKYLVDSSTPADWFVSFPLKECADFFQLPYTGVVDRPVLQEILLEECARYKKDFIQNGVPVTGYRNEPDFVVAELADGTEFEADVLVGADGIWSSIRAQMYDEGPVKQPSKDGLKKQGTTYSGYSVFAGEAVMDLPDYDHVGYNVYVGPGKYFVKSDVGAGRVQWYAFCSLPPGTAKASDSWAGDSKTSSDRGRNVLEYVSDLHRGWSPEIEDVLRRTPPENIEQRDLYDRPLNIFQSWADGRVVLVGDAVHPVMPNLGQGGCQAMEDAFELAKTLHAAKLHGQQLDQSSVHAALQTFYKNRILRVWGVSFLSRLASDLIIHAFSTPWSPHDQKGQDWRSYLTFAWKPVLQYLIFPAQFLFLYSYHPTGPMGDLPKKLESEWRKRHAVDKEIAFAKQRAGLQESARPSFFQRDDAPPAPANDTFSGLPAFSR